MQSAFACPSCGAKTMGHFCGNCGEKEVGQLDYSVRHYLSELATALTLLASKVLRSQWLLLSKPGYLSSEYFRGRRVRYVKPLQLFVFLNVIYYLSLFFCRSPTLYRGLSFFDAASLLRRQTLVLSRNCFGDCLVLLSYCLVLSFLPF